LERHGSHYLLEQGLTAMLLAGQACTVAPAQEYIALPSSGEVQIPTAVMHHYVADSKARYFRQGWRVALAAATAAGELRAMHLELPSGVEVSADR
jgi:hypothetical protein